MRPHETIRGRIHYTSTKPGLENTERGREFFTITKHKDRRRTLRAHAEIDDQPNVLRDVILTLDGNWKPLDAFVRLSVGDQTFGTSWFKFHDTFAECEGFLEANADSNEGRQGRFSERVEYQQKPDLFGTHPIQGDAWHLNSIDISNGPCVKVFDRFLMSSLDHRGATGPSLVWHDAGMIVEFIGEEKLTVGAGTFDALHFCYGDRTSKKQGAANGEHPHYDVWVTADGDFILLKAMVGGYMQTHYELMELTKTSAESLQ